MQVAATIMKSNADAEKLAVQTLLGAVGAPDVGAKLLAGYDVGGTTFKVHLDGYDQRDMLAGSGAGPESLLKRSMVSASRGNSRSWVSNSSQVSGMAGSEVSFS